MKTSMGNREIFKKKAMDIVEKSPEGLTPKMLAQKLKNLFSTDRKTASGIIKELVNKGELGYLEQHGHTVLCRALNKPFRVSPDIVLKPPEISYFPENNEAVINLKHGVSFGSGHHPTTRLCIRAINHVLKERAVFKYSENSRVLDIGTGSGVLAICALKLGIKKGLGIDVDACAIKEAKDNAIINGLGECLGIFAKPLDEIAGKFDLIVANLRLPTLVSISGQVVNLCKGRGCLVFSGMKTEEMASLDRAYTPFFKKIWQKDEKGWAGAAYLRAEF